MREAVIVSSVRTAVGKALKGTLRQARPDDMAAAAIEGALARVPAIKPEMVEDVILGCAMPEGEQGMNVARISALLAGIPHTAAAMTVNRFCSSGLQAIALAARAVECGECDVAVAGGTESMSLVPMGGQRYLPQPDAGGRPPRGLPGHGPHRGAAGAEVRHRPRADRRLRPGLPPEGGRGHRRRDASRTRSCP